MKKIFAMLLVVTVFGVVLGGCSKADEGTDATTTSGGATTGTTDGAATTTGS